MQVNVTVTYLFKQVDSVEPVTLEYPTVVHTEPDYHFDEVINIIKARLRSHTQTLFGDLRKVVRIELAINNP